MNSKTIKIGTLPEGPVYTGYLIPEDKPEIFVYRHKKARKDKKGEFDDIRISRIAKKVDGTYHWGLRRKSSGEKALVMMGTLFDVKLAPEVARAISLLCGKVIPEGTMNRQEIPSAQDEITRLLTEVGG